MMKRIMAFLVLSMSVWVIHAQSLINTIKDKAYVYCDGKQIEMESHLEIPDGEEPLQRYLSQLLFADEKPTLMEAYHDFLKLWKGKLLEPNKEIGGLSIQSITLNIFKEYEKQNSFASYHVEAKASFIPKEMKAKANQMALLERLRKGVDAYFVYDLKEHEVLKLDQILVPAAYDKVIGTLGDSINLYAEDWCLMFSSEKGAGRFTLNAESEKYFTDYFKQMVGRNMPGKDTPPRFLRGKKGLHDFFLKEGKYVYAADGEPADTVTLSLRIAPNGYVDSIAVLSSASKNDSKALAICRKMPIWKPAFQDGKAVSSFVNLSIPFISIWGDEPPQYPDGPEELMKYLGKDLKIPSSAFMKEKIDLKLLIEKDGTPVYAGIANNRVNMNEALIQQFIMKIMRMPKWNPAKKNGKAIRMQIPLPIRLNITDDPYHIPND